MTNTITREIEAIAATLPEGQTLSAKGLLHLGSREAVDQALSRLVKRQKLLRAGRGVYVRPVSGKFGTRPPSAVKVVEALAAETGETISQTGAAAANALGLTTQVPVKEVFYTSGRTRTLKLGKQTIELQHMPAWQTVLPASKAGQVVRALAWLGKGEVEALSLFWNVRLTPREVEELKGVTRTLPTWLARRIGQFVTHV